MSTTAVKNLTCFLMTIFPIFWMAQSSDPDILSDFTFPKNITTVDGNFFSFTGMRGLLSRTPENFTVTKASLLKFPAKIGQSVAFALLRFPAGSLNPPHTHVRFAELLFVLEGGLEAGFVDTNNKLYYQKLVIGDMFVFPKGLVHFQFNSDAEEPATAVSAFGCADAGTVSIPDTVFKSVIDDLILAKAFKTDVSTIQKIKASFAAKA